jgi:hypothetical protein
VVTFASPGPRQKRGNYSNGQVNLMNVEDTRKRFDEESKEA